MYVSIETNTPMGIHLAQLVELSEQACVCEEVAPEDKVRLKEAMEKSIIRITDILDDIEISFHEF